MFIGRLVVDPTIYLDEFAMTSHKSLYGKEINFYGTVGLVSGGRSKGWDRGF